MFALFVSRYYNKFETSWQQLVSTSLSKQGLYSHDITILLQPCVVNFITILLQQVCISELLGQPCSKSDILVKLVTTCQQVSLLRRGFKNFLVSSYGNTLDKHFSSNAGDAIRGRGETKYRENESERSLCLISHDICAKGTISVPSVKTGQGDGRA